MAVTKQRWSQSFLPVVRRAKCDQKARHSGDHGDASDRADRDVEIGAGEVRSLGREEYKHSCHECDQREQSAESTGVEGITTGHDEAPR